MGASTWVYFTPYDPRPAIALRQLRERVFASGDYRKPATAPERLAQFGALPLPAEVHRQAAAQMRSSPGAADSPEIQQLIVHSERLAEEASRREPEYLRLMEALRNGTLDSLPEAREWNALALRLLGPVPEAAAAASRSRKSAAGEIAMLLLQAGENGTHSILDIMRVGKRASHATAFPLAPSVLQATFGTTEPSRAQAETSELAFAEELRWQAVYFAVYAGEAPAEWAFVGSSGD